MKVLITNPPWPGPGYGARSDVRWPHKRSDKFIEYPIYLAYLVAVVRESGYPVEFLDGILEELGIEEFGRRVGEIAPDVVVLESSTPSISFDLQSAAAVKKFCPGAKTVLVGSHVTVFHNEILAENPAVDAVCRGEFDRTVAELVAATASGKDWSEVAGMTWRENGQVRVNPPRPLIENLDELPFPARDVIKCSDYRQGTFRGKVCTTVITSRGCPFRCIYCLWPNTLYGHRFRARSAANVVDELEEAVNKYGVDEVYFDDDSMALDRQRMLDICRLINERNLKFEWIAQCRVDSMDEEVLRAMKNAGCRYIRFGVESGSEKILKLIKKGIRRDQVRSAFRFARRIGIRTQAFFLFGVPGEDEETIRRTIEFAKEIKPDSAQFAVAIPHPGTELFEICREKNWLRYDTWEDFSSCRAMIQTPQLSLEDVEKARVRAYRSFYFRPSFVFHTLLNIKSWDDLKSIWRSFRSILSRIGFFNK